LEERQSILIHRTKKKFRDFQEEETPVIAKRINQIAFTCGVREPIDDMECMFLAQFLKKEFRDFSLTEIEEACEKYAAGKLEFTESHFQAFTKDFIAKILKSYRTYRNKALKKYHDEMERQEEAKEPTEEEKKEIEKEYLETVLFKKYENALENDEVLTFDDQIAVDLFRKMFKKGVFFGTNQPSRS